MRLEAPHRGRTELPSRRSDDALLAIVSVPAPRVALETFVNLELQDARERFVWDARLHGGESDDTWAFVGRGVAHRIDVSGSDRFAAARDAMRAFWNSVAEDRESDFAGLPSARMFGGFSFDASTTREAADPAWKGFGGGLFVLPRWLYAVNCERAFLRLTVPHSELGRALARAREVALRLEGAPTRAPLAHAPELASRVDAEATLESWSALVDGALSAIRNGRAEKLVAARRSRVSLPRELDLGASLAHLARVEPASIRFAFEEGHATFFGATPESLVRVQGMNIFSAALAGSRPRAGDDEAETRALLESEKDQREHAHVVAGIVEALRPLATSVEAAAAPTVRTLAAVHHLETPIHATLVGSTHVLDVVRVLHPTPAVCGTPRAIAREWISTHEPSPRGFYAAPVGWVDREGSGAFAVAIRSALIRDTRAWVYAGAGIVEGSVPSLEYRETTAKLQTMFSALGVTP